MTSPAGRVLIFSVPEQDVLLLYHTRSFCLDLFKAVMVLVEIQENDKGTPDSRQPLKPHSKQSVGYYNMSDPLEGSMICHATMCHIITLSVSLVCLLASCQLSSCQYQKDQSNFRRWRQQSFSGSKIKTRFVRMCGWEPRCAAHFFLITLPNFRFRSNEATERHVRHSRGQSFVLRAFYVIFLEERRR